MKVGWLRPQRSRSEGKLVRDGDGVIHNVHRDTPLAPHPLLPPPYLEQQEG